MANLLLVFTKLASQLTADTLVELAIIPLIFIVQTLVSFACSWGISKAFGFSKRPRNFVVAMGVFGNSNSLPISLVLSLSQTIKGLHWDKVPGDNDDEVAARGILYLLIFQQLGQLVRWSWGFNVLLAPADKYEDTPEGNNSRLENGTTNGENQSLLNESEDSEESEESSQLSGSEETRVGDGRRNQKGSSGSQADGASRSGERTPINHYQNPSSASSSRSVHDANRSSDQAPEVMPTPLNGNHKPKSTLYSFPSQAPTEDTQEPLPEGWKQYPIRCKNALRNMFQTVSGWLSQLNKSIKSIALRIFKSLPAFLQTILSAVYYGLKRFLLGVWSFMNPPLWAMLAAIVVATIPDLQRFFFADGTFFKNSVTSAIRQSGGVAVPLILVVLGGNLARNTLPNERHTKEDDKEETKLLIAALVSRMLLPIIIMAPLLALTAKYVPISILDDPIFIIVCFLITGAPSALQLAQICQINNVYMGAMSRLLFQSYVVWILPSTLILVMCALEVVEWAQR